MTQTQNQKIDSLKAEIERLFPKAETGEQWAHICALEVELENLSYDPGHLIDEAMHFHTLREEVKGA